MNTFLPYSDFQKSAQCLDNKRLGKQRVEAWQIYNTLKQGEFKDCPLCFTTGKIIDKLDNKLKALTKICPKCKGKKQIKTAWYNHPIVKMWKGYELSLCLYGYIMCVEWRKRGFKDTMLYKFKKILKDFIFFQDQIKDPIWLSNEYFHSAMRSNLLRKDKKWYSQFGWKEPNNLSYVWFKEDNSK